MKIFLIIYGVLGIISLILMYFALKNAVEVPQEIDIYDL